jgi:hypothetical protein
MYFRRVLRTKARPRAWNRPSFAKILLQVGRKPMIAVAMDQEVLLDREIPSFFIRLY